MIDPRLLAHARSARGFMPDDEGMALHAAGVAAGPAGPLLEVGSYCGKSTVYLGAAARRAGTVLFALDHHRGSEEHQPGEGYFAADLVDGDGRVDTLPAFRRTVAGAGLEDVVVAVVGPSALVAAHWRTPLGLVFVDGGHSAAAAHADYEGWAGHVVPDGLLVLHDVFPDPGDGGRPPHEVYRRALESGAFAEVSACGSLRVLRRVGPGL